MQTQCNRTRLAGALAVGALLLAVQWTSPGRAAASASDAGAQLGEQTRNEVLDELARQLELQYAIPDTARQLAQAVRAKRKSNAYKRIASAPELARLLT